MGKNVPKRRKMYQIAVTYAKWPENSPNGHIIYQRLPPPKFTQIGIFGLEKEAIWQPCAVANMKSLHSTFLFFGNPLKNGFWVWYLKGETLCLMCTEKKSLRMYIQQKTGKCCFFNKLHSITFY
jgi:hypothetical protein